MWNQQQKPSLNLGRYGLAAAMVNNEIWVAGGIINNSTTDDICSNSETFKTKTAHKITDTVEILNLNCMQYVDDYATSKYNCDNGGE